MKVKMLIKYIRYLLNLAYIAIIHDIFVLKLHWYIVLLYLLQNSEPFIKFKNTIASSIV